jgi:branched-chain amino acid transport system substrate-binding protein
MTRTTMTRSCLGLIGIGLALLGAGPGAGRVGAQPREHVVGATLELSGQSAIWGSAQRNAITMLVDEINGRGGIGGARIRLVVYDNQSKETEAIVVAKKLVEQDHALAVIGGGTTPTTLPLIPYLTDKRVPLCSMGSSNRIVEPVRERAWIFKTPNTTRDVVSKLLEHFTATGITKVGFLSVNNAYGDAGKAEFEAAAGKAGVEVVAWEKFGASDRDMKPQLGTLKRRGPQALVIWAIPPAASIVARNARELGIAVPLVYDLGAAVLPKFIELAGGAAEGALAVTGKLEVLNHLDGSDPQRAALARFKKDYEARYREPASGIGGMAYDCMLLVARALERAGGDRAKLRDALEGMTGVPGVTGTYNMSADDHNGLTTKDLLIGRVSGNAWTPVHR